MPRLSLHTEQWRSKTPFCIAGYCWNSFDVVVVELSDGAHTGKGEGFPVHYLGETVESLCLQIEAIAARVESGLSREALLESMPAGGARNAIDAALWDLEAKTTGQSIWALTGIEPKTLDTAYTIGIEDSAASMGARARAAAGYPILKIKLDRHAPLERVSAIRAARPDARLTVDVNQDWTFQQLAEVAPGLARLGVELIEQPLRRGADQPLEDYVSPVPLCADESCQGRAELAEASRRYQIINIKLDKAGGLTEALLLAREVRARGLGTLVSNMGGTSLAMAPAFVLAQWCRYVELDGPLLLKHDRLSGLRCHLGRIEIPGPDLWG